VGAVPDAGFVGLAVFSFVPAASAAGAVGAGGAAGSDQAALAARTPSAKQAKAVWKRFIRVIFLLMR
jgi:hypothetical protein